MITKSKIINNAVRILGYLIDNDAILGNDIELAKIFEALDLPENEFDSADTYLLQKKYVDGTMGGMAGSRWLTVRGIDFYEEQRSNIETTTNIPMVNDIPDRKKVFVVHGRDSRLKDDFFSFLRALGLRPIEWSEALKSTGKATPYTGEVIESAFKNAQAVIVLLSPDDEVRLSPNLWKKTEEESEKTISLQARPNVLFEAGMAFGTHYNRTLLVEVGQVKKFSDVAGRHVVKLSNSAEQRNEIAQRLKTAGCDVSTNGSDWLNTGNFDITRDISCAPVGCSHKDLAEGDIIAILNNWWPRSGQYAPDDVYVNFNELDNILSLPPGSTKKYITKVASKKGFKTFSSGNVVATFKYDVTTNDFGTYSDP